MTRFSIALLATACATAATAKSCTNMTVPVTVSARNGRFDIQPPSNNIDVTDFILNFGRRGANYSQELLQEMYTVSGTYNIAATYCEPATSQPGSILQILTHGITFDRSYWDYPHNSYNYSYVNQALDRGYSTFSYDRFGIGESQHGDPIDEVQSWLEIAVLEELTTLLRETRVPGITTSFAKTVHVGHSFGSIQSYALSAMRPDLSDGLVLTGFTQVPDYIPYFLLGSNFISVIGSYLPALEASYEAGYIVPQNLAGTHQNLFAPGNFDPEVLAVAYETEQPVTYGELLTIGAPASVVSEFTGPVLIITGDYDVPFCGGNCTAPDSTFLDKSAPMFSHSSHFETFIVPKSGHGLNLEYTWPITYGKILDFVDAQV